MLGSLLRTDCRNRNCCLVCEQYALMLAGFEPDMKAPPQDFCCAVCDLEDFRTRNVDLWTCLTMFADHSVPRAPMRKSIEAAWKITSVSIVTKRGLHRSWRTTSVAFRTRYRLPEPHNVTRDTLCARAVALDHRKSTLKPIEIRESKGFPLVFF